MKRTILPSIALALSALLFSSCCTNKKCCSSGPLVLWNGKNLNNWKYVLADASVPKEKVWSVKDGVLICTGAPVGYLYSEMNFQDFRMEVEYRWPAGPKPGNSGIFSRINDTSKALPRTIEAQLQHGNAGDLLGLQGMKIDSNQPRYFHVAKHELAGDVDGIKKLSNAEATPGEWNRVVIEARGPNYTVWVNGQKVNEVTGVEVRSGSVGLQSEGGEIHFRKAIITPLSE